MVENLGHLQRCQHLLGSLIGVSQPAQCLGKIQITPDPRVKRGQRHKRGVVLDIIVTDTLENVCSRTLKVTAK